MSSRVSAAILAAIVAASMLVPQPAAVAQVPTVRLLGEQTIPHRTNFQDTVVGGLSSIDHDPETGRYALLSDDWSDYSPARYYTAAIELDADGLHDVALTDVTLLRRPDGQTYPTIQDWRVEQHGYPEGVRNAFGTVDPEELRIDPLTGDLAWTSEGQRNVLSGGSPADAEPVLLDPTIRPSTADTTPFLVLERDYVGDAGTSIRIVEVSTSRAADVLDRHSLADGDFRPVSKRPLVDLGEPGATIDDIEGITWGPALPSGERTLLLVGGDDFSSAQSTRITALAVG
ncbi:hypothetical protein FHR81_001086 [Actinoalloteichus hoggarensis]|nr:esterase-like activity of phytase family protein [Actinoalloteichus hoggarensis]MBB5920056.1 hypothetical protein [Actinoalloteichus hoggarensis]